MRLKTIPVVFLAFGLSACVETVTGPDAPEGFRRCDTGAAGVAFCGTVTVPEDRGAPGGPWIDLSVAVLKATGSTPASDPVFFLTGGPGTAATASAPRVARTWAGVRRRRDIVLVDRRGTGGSRPLGCARSPDIRDHFGTVLPGDLLAACRQGLETVADLARYGTAAAAEDLEDVRLALGYGAINLRGESYGTRLGLEYARRFRDAVRSLTLVGAVPPSFRSPLSYARDAQAALDAVFDDCAAAPSCAAAYPDLRADFASLLARLDGGPVPVRYTAPGQGPVDGTLSRGDFGYAVRGLLYGDGALTLPARIAAAAETADLSGFAAAYAQRTDRVWGTLSLGLYLSVLCAEDVPRIREDEIAAETAGTFLGAYLVREYRRACEGWPAAQPAPGFHEPVVVDRPVLLVSGRRDPVSPPRWADRAALGMPNSVHVVFPYGGHGFTGTHDPGCLSRLEARFLETADGSALDLSCATDGEPLPFL